MTTPKYMLTRQDGARFYFGDEGLNIGRHSTNQVILSDPGVSRLHASILVAQGRLWVRDHNSAGGTFVNGNRVAGQQELRLGDTLQIGKSTFQAWHNSPQGAQKAPAAARNRNLLGLGILGAAAVIILIVFIAMSGDGQPGFLAPGFAGGDDQPPSVVIEFPTTLEAFTTVEGNLSLAGTAFDNSSIAKVEWSLAGGASGTADGTSAWSVQNILLLPGDNHVTVTAYDAAGNTYSDQVVVTRNTGVVFGLPQANPDGLFVSQAVDVLIRSQISASAGVADESVHLLQLDAQDQVEQDLGQMFDDGDLAHGDDIKGDGVYSTLHTFTTSKVGELHLRISASATGGGSNVDYSPVIVLKTFTQLTDQEFNEVISTQDQAVDTLNSASNQGLDGAIDATVDWLNNQPQVAEAKRAGNDIKIQYASGLGGGLWIHPEPQEGEDVVQGGMGSTSSTGGMLLGESNLTSPGLQTWAGSDAAASSNQDVILDKDVFVYSPFESVFGSGFRTSLESIFTKSDIEFNVSSCTNQDCTINLLDSLTNYGVVIFYTHGSNGGDELGTGEIATAANQVTYADLIKQNKVAIWRNVPYTKGFLFVKEKKADFYAVTSDYFAGLAGTFPNSIIYNGSCYSTQGADLRNAFLNKGAKTYFGFDDVVHTNFDTTMAKALFEGIVVDLKTTGQAFKSGQTDPLAPNAEFEMFGSQDMHFTQSLINGDFETGDLTGWSTSGDGRVILQLSSQAPTQGKSMGIISTGLGFTTSTGEISQSFKVLPGETQLSLRWNFLSEEFPEYVGSQFQDYFKIIIRAANGKEQVIFEKRIDNYASDYTLSEVSPAVVFDQGDVSMTGWQTFTYDLSAYANQSITLILSAGDVGDSIYDSAILLDEIKMGAKP